MLFKLCVISYLVNKIKVTIFWYSCLLREMISLFKNWSIILVNNFGQKVAQHKYFLISCWLNGLLFFHSCCKKFMNSFHVYSSIMLYIYQHANISAIWIYIFACVPQNQLIGKGKDTIFDAGARIKGAGVRIKRALSPGRNIDPMLDVSPSCSPSSSPKVPRLSFEPEISDDDDDDGIDDGSNMPI